MIEIIHINVVKNTFIKNIYNKIKIKYIGQ